MTMEILKVQDLCKTYGKGEAKVEALKKVSFSLDKGEFAAVVGESGSGKSTLLNCIGALDTPTSGHILVDGQDLFSMKEEQRTIFRRRNIGFIFQSFQLVSELNVYHGVYLWGSVSSEPVVGRGKGSIASDHGADCKNGCRDTGGTSDRERRPVIQCCGGITSRRYPGNDPEEKHSFLRRIL